MHVAVTGATGFVGSALLARLDDQGHRVTRITRRPTRETDIQWNPAQSEIDLGKLDGVDAVVHLAGENIAKKRWTSARRRELLASRVKSTEFLVSSLGKLSSRPTNLISASAIGIYGDRSDEVLDETATPGSGFLADLCKQWESAAMAAEAHGIRVVVGRLGLVLSTDDGAMSKMLPIFRLGMGGRLGTGRQFWSWIGIDDLVASITHLLQDSHSGSYNLVAPNAVTNREFTRTLARHLRRPAFLLVPTPAIRLLLGQMGRELMLASARVKPSRLIEQGFEFQHPTLDALLQYQLTDRSTK